MVGRDRGDAEFAKLVEAHRVVKTGAVIAEHPVVADAVRSGALTCRQAEVLGPLATEARAGLFARDAEVLVDTISGLPRFDDVAPALERVCCTLGAHLDALWTQIATIDYGRF